jgi:hypothetical protein
VKKAQAKEALKLSDSSFGHSQRGAYLVEKYREAAEVQEMLEYRETTPKGAKTLLKFLQDWHHNNSNNQHDN